LLQVGSLFVDIGANLSGLAAGLQQAHTMTTAYATRLNSVSQGLVSAGKMATLAVTVPVLALGAAAIKAGSEFEAAMSSVAAVSGATAEDMQRLSAAAKELGLNSKYSATEAVEGAEELIKAGLSMDQVLSGGLKGALDLAAAGEVSVAEAAEIASTALNAFKRDGMDVADAANILAGAANASATDVGTLRLSLSMVSAVAAGVNLSFQDTNAALAVMANNGLKGSDAGTSLKTMLMNLQPVTDRQKNAFKELGLVTADGANQFYKANGQLKSMSEIAGLLQTSMAGMTDQERMLAMEIMFGTDAIRAANILYKEGAQGIEGMTAAMLKVEAADVAAKRLDNLKGAFTRLKATLETVGIKIYEAIQKPLTALVQGLTEVIAKIGLLSPAALRIAVVFAAIAAAIGPLLIVLGLLAAAFNSIMGLIGGTTLASLGAAFSSVIVPVVAVTAAVVALGLAIKEAWNTSEGFRNAVTEAFERAERALAQAGQALQQLFGGGNSLGAVTNALQGLADIVATVLTPAWLVLSGVIGAAISIISGLLSGVVQGISLAITKVNEWWQAFKQSEQGADIISKLSAAWELFSQNIAKLKEMFQPVIDKIVEIGGKFGEVFGKSAVIAALVVAFAPLVVTLTAVLGVVYLVAKAFEALQKTWVKVQSAAQTVGDAFSKVRDSIKSALAGLEDSVSGPVAHVVAAWEKAWGELAPKVETIWGLITDIIALAAGKLVDVISEALAPMMTVVSAIWESIQSAAKSAWDTIKEAIITAAAPIVDSVISLISPLLGLLAALWDSAKSTAGSKWEEIKQTISNALGDLPGRMLQMGQDIVQGLADGITSMIGTAVEAASNLADSVISVLTGVKGFLTHSPSVKMHELGVYVVQGLANGIYDATPEAEEAARELAERVGRALNALQTGFRDIIQEGVNALAERLASLDLSLAALDVSPLSQYERDTARLQLQLEKLNAELAANAETQNTLKEAMEAAAQISGEASDEYKEYAQQLKAAQREQSMLSIEVQKNSIEMQKLIATYNKDAAQMYEDVAELQQELVDADRQANEDRLKAAQDYADKRRDVEARLAQDVQQLLADSAQEQQDIIAAGLAAEQQALEDFNQALASKQQSLYSWSGLFDSPGLEAVSGGQLLSNLESQVSAFDRWQADIASLAQRGIDEGLLEELRGMGPQAAAQINALTTLTDSELGQYAGLWKQKQEQAKNEAAAVMESQRQAMILKLQEIRANTQEQLALQQNEMATQLAAMQATAKAELAKYQEDWEETNKKIEEDSRKAMDEIGRKFTALADKGRDFGLQLWENFNAGSFAGYLSAYAALSRYMESLKEMVISQLGGFTSTGSTVTVPAFADGGPVTQTGLALVHAGEFVLTSRAFQGLLTFLGGMDQPAPAAVPAAAGGNTFNFYTNDTSEIMRILRRQGVKW